MSQCAVETCDRTAVSHGWCDRHYRRWRNHGTVELTTFGKIRALPERERFWAKVDKSAGVDGCWLWTGAPTVYGYGQFRTASGLHPAHVYAWVDVNGPVPDGLQLDHLCHNGTGCIGGRLCLHRRCVNPAHLEAVTNAVNGLRGNGPAANHARKTHCTRGHPFAGDNLIRGPGRRVCRACKHARDARYRQQRRATV